MRMSPPRRVTYMQRGGGAAWLRPLTAGLLVAAEVGHGLVQPRATDAHEQEGDDLLMDLARGRDSAACGASSRCATDGC